MHMDYSPTEQYCIDEHRKNINDLYIKKFEYKALADNVSNNGLDALKYWYKNLSKVCCNLIEKLEYRLREHHGTTYFNNAFTITTPSIIISPELQTHMMNIYKESCNYSKKLNITYVNIFNQYELEDCRIYEHSICTFDLSKTHSRKILTYINNKTFTDEIILAYMHRDLKDGGFDVNIA